MDENITKITKRIKFAIEQSEYNINLAKQANDYDQVNEITTFMNGIIWSLRIIESVTGEK